MKATDIEEKILNLSDGRQVKVQYITEEDGHVHPEVNEDDPFNIAQDITDDDTEMILAAIGPQAFE